MRLNQMIEKENIKAEIAALSSIRETLFKENKNAEAVVIINVQKRLRKLLSELDNGNLAEKAEQVPSPKIKCSDIESLSYREKQDLLKYTHLAFHYFGISLTELLRMDKDTIEWLYIFVDKTIRKESESRTKKVSADININVTESVNVDKIVNQLAEKLMHQTESGSP